MRQSQIPRAEPASPQATHLGRFAPHAMAVLWVVAVLPIVQPLAQLESVVLPPGPSMLGMPLGALLERTVLWGIVPVALSLRLGFARVLTAASRLGIDALVAAAPSVWDISVMSVAFGTVVLPSQLLLHWTIDRRCLAGRATLHFLLTAGLLVGVVPALLLQLAGASAHELTWSGSVAARLMAEALLVPLVLAVAATLEFVSSGHGTPMPSDPPRRLVTSGPYAYVANPMQIAKVTAPIVLALALQRPIVAVAGIFMFAWGVVVTYPREAREVEARFGTAWRRYRQNVSRWFPRWTPWRDPDLAPARLYVDAACTTCSRLGRWFVGIPGIEVKAIADYPGTTPQRLTYDPANGGTPVDGVRAFARALEHRHFGWALWGWTMRVPGVRWLGDCFVDMVADGRREVAVESHGDRCPVGPPPRAPTPPRGAAAQS